jgi:hypothetical protein
VYVQRLPARLCLAVYSYSVYVWWPPLRWSSVEWEAAVSQAVQHDEHGVCLSWHGVGLARSSSVQ